MRRAGLLGALVLLVVVNLAVLGGVAWNRAGQPEASLLLTERELPLYDSFVRAEENSGLALQLTLYGGSYSPDWLDERKLLTLGFRPERHDTADAAEYETGKQALPRQAWVVLEFDGPAWQAALADSETELAGLEEVFPQLAAADSPTAQVGDDRFPQFQGPTLAKVHNDLRGQGSRRKRRRAPDHARHVVARDRPFDHGSHNPR